MENGSSYTPRDVLIFFLLRNSATDSGSMMAKSSSSPDKCRESCEQSLSNLGVDCIDLFYVHRFDLVTPVEKTVEALVELKK